MVRLDGPLGSRLQDSGHPVSAPAWSARVLRSAPQAISALHREYAALGCDVHRANTFRCTRRACGDDWAELARLAVQLARAEAKPGQRVAGSLGPLEDCYRPDLAPVDAFDEHLEAARVVAEGVDLLICETFPHAGEAVETVRAAVATGRETWVSFTAGPDATLLTAAQVGAAAQACVTAGARAVLVNCIAAELTSPYVRALAGCGVPFGAYANTATWNGAETSVARYGELAAEWRALGAKLIGGCCGASPEHLRAAWGDAP
ncbi:MAG: homocysteine S-methyltransferase family protein [Archangiaceae bacterium]|nr:homocysteine S-methyltransferase family protein [Archangiaceae bacterium]